MIVSTIIIKVFDLYIDIRKSSAIILFVVIISIAIIIDPSLKHFIINNIIVYNKLDVVKFLAQLLNKY